MGDEEGGSGFDGMAEGGLDMNLNRGLAGSSELVGESDEDLVSA